VAPVLSAESVAVEELAAGVAPYPNSRLRLNLRRQVGTDVVAEEIEGSSVAAAAVVVVASSRGSMIFVGSPGWPGAAKDAASFIEATRDRAGAAAVLPRISLLSTVPSLGGRADPREDWCWWRWGCGCW
jgi:hypothetical protein